jgi:hypothetical protein
LQAAATARAILFLQLVNDALGLQRWAVADGTEPDPFVLERAATVGTGRGSQNGFEAVGLGRGETLAAVAGMPGWGTAGMGAVGFGSLGLERPFR